MSTSSVANLYDLTGLERVAFAVFNKPVQSITGGSNTYSLIIQSTLNVVITPALNNIFLYKVFSYPKYLADESVLSRVSDLNSLSVEKPKKKRDIDDMINTLMQSPISPTTLAPEMEVPGVQLSNKPDLTHAIDFLLKQFTREDINEVLDREPQEDLLGAGLSFQNSGFNVKITSPDPVVNKMLSRARPRKPKNFGAYPRNYNPPNYNYNFNLNKSKGPKKLAKKDETLSKFVKETDMEESKEKKIEVKVYKKSNLINDLYSILTRAVQYLGGVKLTPEEKTMLKEKSDRIEPYCTMGQAANIYNMLSSMLKDKLEPDQVTWLNSNILNGKLKPNVYTSLSSNISRSKLSNIIN